MRNINKTMTYESLYYAVVLLFTDNKEEFEYAYEKAMHDKNGGGCWFYLYDYNKKINAYQRKKYAMNKGKKND